MPFPKSYRFPLIPCRCLPDSAVLFYTNERNEDEYVLLAKDLHPKRFETVTREQFEAIAARRHKEQMDELQSQTKAT